MNRECFRIADQLRRAFTGDAWHGPPLIELLDGVRAEPACTHLFPSTHTIWELVLHIHMYVRATIEATRGIAMPKWYGTEEDWPVVGDTSASAWAAARNDLFRDATELVDAIEEWSDERLTDTVPGREYDFYILFHGVVQHSLYHGGQIAILKRAAGQVDL
jgi:hypothetical protein